MHIAICDNNPTDLLYIKSLLNQYQHDKCFPLIWTTFTNTAELITAIRPAKYDLLIIDILSSDTDDLSIIRKIYELDRNFPIIIHTSTPKYAVESYSMKVLDYIMKPFDRIQLYEHLDNWFSERISLTDGFYIKTHTGFAKVLYSKLMYVEVISKHLYFHLFNGSIYNIRLYFYDK